LCSYEDGQGWEGWVAQYSLPAGKRRRTATLSTVPTSVPVKEETKVAELPGEISTEEDQNGRSHPVANNLRTRRGGLRVYPRGPLRSPLRAMFSNPLTSPPFVSPQAWSHCVSICLFVGLEV